MITTTPPGHMQLPAIRRPMAGWKANANRSDVDDDFARNHLTAAQLTAIRAHCDSTRPAGH